MRKGIMKLFCLIATILFTVGCSNGRSYESDSIEDMALKEAEKIATEQGYSLKLDETIAFSDILVGDSEAFKLIKDASIRGGYLEEDFNSMTEDREVVGYELKEKSKEGEPIILCLVIDKERIIGAYLDYSGYIPGIAQVDYKDDFK